MYTPTFADALMEPAFKRARTSALANELGLGMDMQDTCGVLTMHLGPVVNTTSIVAHPCLLLPNAPADVEVLRLQPTPLTPLQTEPPGQSDGAHGRAHQHG